MRSLKADDVSGGTSAPSAFSSSEVLPSRLRLGGFGNSQHQSLRWHLVPRKNTPMFFTFGGGRWCALAIPLAIAFVWRRWSSVEESQIDTPYAALEHQLLVRIVN